MNALRAWYAGLQERERRVVAGGAIAVAVLVLVLGILLPLHSALSNARERADTKRADLAWMQAHAAEVRSGGVPPRDTGEAPMVLVDRVGHEVGLGDALRRTQPNGTGVQVQLEGASFDTMLTWLRTLDVSHGLAVETITVDRAPKPGVVNATVTFARRRH
jgi:general secretion pathway protein M